MTLSMHGHLGLPSYLAVSPWAQDSLGQTFGKIISESHCVCCNLHLYAPQYVSIIHVFSCYFQFVSIAAACYLLLSVTYMYSHREVIRLTQLEESVKSQEKGKWQKERSATVSMGIIRMCL